MKILLIRHGRTKGNAEHRYVGWTDESLLSGETARLKKKKTELKTHLGRKQPLLFVSPMKRCVETAGIFFGDRSGCTVQDFREMNFGDFEYRTYRELEANPDTAKVYQTYIDSNGETAFPKGESKAEFEKRVWKAAEPLFQNLLSGDKKRIVPVMIVHGGTIMAILDRFSDPHQDYFYWRIGPGEGYVADLESENGKIRLRDVEHILL